MTKTKKTTPTACTPKKTSLFDSILANEAQSAIDMECTKYANRVGLLFKVLYNRDLQTLRTAFECKLVELIKDTANSIDCELCATKEDC